MLYKYNFSSGKDREGVIFCNWTMSEQLQEAFHQAMIAEVNRLGLVIEKPVKVEHVETVEETRYIQILKESIERIYFHSIICQSSLERQAEQLRLRAFDNQCNSLKEEL